MEVVPGRWNVSAKASRATEQLLIRERAAIGSKCGRCQGTRFNKPKPKLPLMEVRGIALVHCPGKGGESHGDLGETVQDRKQGSGVEPRR